MKTLYTYAAGWLAITILCVAGGVGLVQTVRYSSVQADNLRLDDQEATVRAINKAIPGVVSITVFSPPEIVAEGGGLSAGPGTLRRGAGTGFLISADGLILTNKHVATVAKPTQAEYQVTLYSGKQYHAQFIGVDPINDLAILKIFDKNLPYLQIGDSGKISVGTTVIAIGNALGRYDNSATKGIVSGLGRNLEAAGPNGEESLSNVIQTDAQINEGNSGGPLIDLNGAVVGINVAKDAGGESIGFAIPINEAKPVITSAKVNGRIIRSHLGVRYMTVTPDIAKQKLLPRTTGAFIIGNGPAELGVIPGSPADKAGLKEGDIIFEIDGKSIDERTPLQSYISQFNPGKKLGLKIQRGSEIFTRIVTLDELK